MSSFVADEKTDYFSPSRFVGKNNNNISSPILNSHLGALKT